MLQRITRTALEPQSSRFTFEQKVLARNTSKLYADFREPTLRRRALGPGRVCP